MSPPKIPRRTALETDPPVVFASRLALREGNHKKPIYEIHKWWARRLGSVFRTLLLGATTSHKDSTDLRNGSFYRKHDLSGLLVLDPFVGGGTTLVEAAKLNANVIGVDIDPVACFITAKELELLNEESLLAAYRSVENKASDKIIKWYRTRLQDGREGTAIYTFWVDIIKCPHCKIQCPGHPHYQLSRDHRKRKQTVFCAHCGEVSTLPLHWKRFACTSCGRLTNVTSGPVRNSSFTCPSCGTISAINSLVSRNTRLPRQIFALEVLIDGTSERIFKEADADDIALNARARRAWGRRKRGDRFVPPEGIPIKDRDDPRPLSYGYRRYGDLFNERQLLCLSIVAEAIAAVKDTKSREFLAIAFSDCLAANNMFCFYAFDYQKLTPLFGLHAYRRVSRPVENNVWGIKIGRGSFIKCFQKALRGKRYARKPFEYRYQDSKDVPPQQVFTGERINSTVYHSLPPQRLRTSPYAVLLNQSSEGLRPIRSGSVDLILTDPPYYDNLPYSELSDFYHVWLRRLHLKTYPGRGRRRTPISESLYVRRGHPRRAPGDHERFLNGLTKVFAECYRVLKDSGLLVFTFHHNNPRAWAVLAAVLLKSGFHVSNVFPIRSEGRSQFHSAEGNLKWDVVFCCRKATEKTERPEIRDLEPYRSKIWSKADGCVSDWKEVLSHAGLDFSAADARSLRSGFMVMYLTRGEHCPRDLTSFFGQLHPDPATFNSR